MKIIQWEFSCDIWVINSWKEDYSYQKVDLFVSYFKVHTFKSERHRRKTQNNRIVITYVCWTLPQCTNVQNLQTALISPVLMCIWVAQFKLNWCWFHALYITLGDGNNYCFLNFYLNYNKLKAYILEKLVQCRG